MSKVTVLFTVTLLSLAPLAGSADQAKPPADGNTVRVTAKYAGKGPVDANHRIWVWLFTSPDISAGAFPIAEASIEKNGGVATFTGINEKAVYVAVAYDEKGNFEGSAPPPSGSPTAFYGVKAPTDKPAPVVPGPQGEITIAFTDAIRMP